MTREEAIRRLKLYKEKVLPITLEEAVDMANEALEKQIPKKPKENIIGVYCPECRYFLSGTGHYCEHCGQAIDWTEEGE